MSNTFKGVQLVGTNYKTKKGKGFDSPEYKEKREAIRAYRKEASRLVSAANKRVSRLESNNLKDSPAYKTYIESGGKFGIQGKSYNEVQAEVSRLRKFLDSETSTVRGANRTLKEMAENTGIRYKNLDELKDKSAKFFELSSKVEQYLRSVEDMASAIGYQKIWQAVNEYVKQEQQTLDGSVDDVDEMVERISKALAEYEGEVNIDGANWYMLK